MAFSHSISALPGRRENSPGSQAIPGEPKFEIPGRVEIPGIALYGGEISFFQKISFLGPQRSKIRCPSCWKLIFTCLGPYFHFRPMQWVFVVLEGGLVFPLIWG